MSTTRAAVWHGGGEVRLHDVPLPTPGAGEVLVRVRLATVCGSDLHTVAGRRPAPCPSVLGHEAVGDVVATGEGAPVSIGQRVVWSVTVACGACARCRAGRRAKCRTVRKVGHEPFDSDWPLSGGYAEHVLLPRGTAIVSVPDDMPDAVAAPAACSTATVMAAVEAAGPLLGARVLVCGAGMLGLGAVAAAVAAGASTITVVDVDPRRLATAARFGATDLVEAGDDLPEVDVALELSGAPHAVEASYGALDVGGRLVLAGSVSPGPTWPVDPEHVVRSCLTVTGVHNYEPHHLRRAIELLDSTPHLAWTDLVAPPRPLSGLAALLHQESRMAPRTSVSPLLRS